MGSRTKRTAFNGSRASHRSLRGFSIVELLVVVGIIAVLVAMLLPAVSQSRAVARTQVCASNLRQVYIGLASYASENNDFFPAIGSSGGLSIGWWNVLGNAGYLGGYETPVRAVPAARRWRVFQCPSEPGSRFGLNGVFRDDDVGQSWNDEGVTFYMARRRGTSYDINRNIMPGTSYTTPRKGFSRDFYQPNLSGYVPPAIGMKRIYGRSDIRIVSDNGEMGGGLGTNWHASMFDSTFDNTLADYAVASAGTKDRIVANLYAFRHPGGNGGLNHKGEDIRIGTANAVYLDGRVEQVKSIMDSGLKFYTPMFPGN